MKITRLEIPELILVELDVYRDDRGFFVERFNERKFRELGLPTRFAQDNHSSSKPGCLRGLHYQTDPAQGKLVGCLRGRLWDVVVDLRPASPHFGKHAATELSAENGRLLWVPPGFAHGFCVLGDEPADMLYKVDALYNAKSESGIRWNDPELKIPWPLRALKASARDETLPSFAEYRKNPPAWA